MISPHLSQGTTPFLQEMQILERSDLLLLSWVAASHPLQKPLHQLWLSQLQPAALDKVTTTSMLLNPMVTLGPHGTRPLSSLQFSQPLPVLQWASGGHGAPVFLKPIAVVSGLFSGLSPSLHLWTQNNPRVHVLDLFSIHSPIWWHQLYKSFQSYMTLTPKFISPSPALWLHPPKHLLDLLTGSLTGTWLLSSPKPRPERPPQTCPLTEQMVIAQAKVQRVHPDLSLSPTRDIHSVSPFYQFYL